MVRASSNQQCKLQCEHIWDTHIHPHKQTHTHREREQWSIKVHIGHILNDQPAHYQMTDFKSNGQCHTKSMLSFEHTIFNWIDSNGIVLFINILHNIHSTHLRSPSPSNQIKSNQNTTIFIPHRNRLIQFSHTNYVRNYLFIYLWFISFSSP